jgi:hypothetical protein
VRGGRPIRSKSFSERSLPFSIGMSCRMLLSIPYSGRKTIGIVRFRLRIAIVRFAAGDVTIVGMAGL